ncbi:MAG: type II toxin-antitoxin system HipA family toxin [Saccharofermentans sp.]|nr:type II toxin-antitoxin system HipA family toxin [Saccharofermentans sp.]
MIDTAEVFLWGTRIGIVHQDEDKAYISFEYDKNFLGSGIELSPIKMPLNGRVYSFPELAGSSFHGAPGLVADSLPDRFGNRVIERWLAEQGRSLSDFNAIDRLCYTGERGMGALEYRPASSPDIALEEDIDVAKMVRFASDILTEKKDQHIKIADDPDYSQLIRLGTSAGGARAKALIAWNEEKHMIKSGQIDAGNGYEYWLMKFDGVNKNGDHDLEDEIEYTRIEYAYSLMARDSGIQMSECRLFEENGRYHFMTKRFDRISDQKLHMQTLGALAHIDYNLPGQASYEEAAKITMRLTNSVADVAELYRRMVFNVIMVNQDDHVKNTSFLMNKKGEWKLAPAYDLTFSYNPDNTWLRAHQMRINGKTERIDLNDLIESGKTMGLGKVKCARMIDQVQSVAERFPEYLQRSGVSDKTVATLSSIRTFVISKE